MEIVLKKIKGAILIIILFNLLFLMFFNNDLALFYGLPLYLIPIINLIFLIFFTKHYINILKGSETIESEFTTVVNHVFRTPLTSIIWITNELKEDLNKEEKLLLIQKIENSTKKLLDIVDLFVGIKNINNTSGYVFEATSIRDILEKTIIKYREDINKKNIKFNIPTFKEIPLLTMDLNKISFVIDSIAENALFYTPKNGDITINADFDKNMLTLKITDTGIGFTNKDKRRLFTKFFRSPEAILMNPNGAGLKLYLAKQIIERHKGKLYVESKGYKQGSSIFIELPLQK